MNKFEGLISLKDASNMFGKAESTLREGIARGKFEENIDCKKFGKQWVFDIKALEREYMKNKEKEIKKMKSLYAMYKEWRKQIEEHNEQEKEIGGSHTVLGSYDCGEGSVREDFSNYAELDTEITFEEMLGLEREYERNNN